MAVDAPNGLSRTLGAGLRWAKRARTALLKRLSAGRKTGNFVFEYRGDHELPPVPFEEATTDHVARIFENWDGAGAMLSSVREALDEGARCFFVSDNEGRAICYLLARSGRQRGDWFIELHESDAVLLSIVTHNAARGQRLAGRLAAGVAERYVARGGRAFLDCAIWNVSAHKAFRAAGFEQIRPEPFPPLD